MFTLILVYPWGDPLKQSSGIEKRSSMLIHLFKKKFTKDVIVLAPIRISSQDVFSEKFTSYKGYGGLLLDLNPTYYFKLIHIVKKNKAKTRIILTGPVGIGGALFTKLIFCRKKDISIIYDAHNVEFERINVGAFSTSRLIARLITKYILLVSEQLAVKYSNCILAISWRDKKKFVTAYRVIPEKIQVVYPVILSFSLKSKQTRTRKVGVLFHGSYSYLPNKEAIEFLERLALYLKSVPFYIAGKGVPTKNVNNIKFLGFVRNLEEFFELGDLAVIPLKRGAGVKLKIIDYLLKGIPVVTTNIGAQGLELTPWKNSIVTSIEKIPKIARFLISSPKFKYRIGYLGKEHIRTLVDEEKNIKNIEKCLEGG